MAARSSPPAEPVAASAFQRNVSHLTFPKTDRLLKRNEFAHLVSKGQTFYGKYIIIQYRKTGNAHIRLGIIITKKFGKANLRNRFKRLIREGFRLSPKPQVGLDMSVRARQNFQFLTLSAVLSDLNKFFSSMERHGPHTTE